MPNDSQKNIESLSSIRVPLTEREKEILILLSKGKTNKEISEDLKLSAATVRNHLSTIFVKLKVKNRAQAAVVALKEGIVSF